MLLNFTAIESLGWVTPHQACFGVTPDISARLQYQFYQPVYILDKDVFPNADEHLGHWLGVTENKGDSLTYWILTESNQVLARSLVRPMEENKLNKQTQEAGETLDLAVTEIEGSESATNLDLLSDLVNSAMPEVDPLMINGFQADNLIGLVFIHKDKCGVPTKAKVIEVDKDTIRVMLEYVHGGLEVVELNLIQETLLSKEQGDKGNKPWTFIKVLNHHTVENGKIEVE
eukprot:10523219-Ditylum_brightwellii.AAC.1